MNPKEITVSAQSSTAVTVEQFLAVVDHIDKRETLRHIIRIENLKNAFIFCNRKRDVDILFKSLKKHGFDVVQMHGDMTQPARLESLSKFKSGEARLLVCSDVVARGIDIKAVSHVFNFDVPIHAEDYVHRIGRTGRAGETGRAFTIASPEDGKFVAAIEALIAQPLPRMAVEGVPPLDLDMSPRRGRGGRPADKKDDGRRSRKPRGEQAPAAEAEAAADTPAPAVESRDNERRRDRPERDRGDRPERERAPRERNDRERNDRDRGDRNDRDRRRDDRGGRRRGRIDELGIGEMTHPDGVVGFGEHMPDFMTRTVQLPVKTSKDVDSDADQADE